VSYRTPEEDQHSAIHRARVQLVLDQAIKDGGSLLAAMDLGEPQEVVELWTDRLWGGLRDQLSDNRPGTKVGKLMSDEDRLAAIVILLEAAMEEERNRILTGYSTAGGDL
jgi:hypothetical protein